LSLRAPRTNGADRRRAPRMPATVGAGFIASCAPATSRRPGSVPPPPTTGLLLRKPDGAIWGGSLAYRFCACSFVQKRAF
jgi:hypothetical protein